MLASRMAACGEFPGGIQPPPAGGSPAHPGPLKTNFMRKFTAPIDPIEHMLPATSSQNEYRPSRLRKLRGWAETSAAASRRRPERDPFRLAGRAAPRAPAAKPASPRPPMIMSAAWKPAPRSAASPASRPGSPPHPTPTYSTPIAFPRFFRNQFEMMILVRDRPGQEVAHRVDQPIPSRPKCWGPCSPAQKCDRGQRGSGQDQLARAEIAESVPAPPTASAASRRRTRA